MSAPTSSFDIRYLSELAMKTIITGLAPAFQVLTSADNTEHIHPTVRIMVNDQEEAAKPGVGIWKQRVDIELRIKADTSSPELTFQAVQTLRQCFYRNDTNSQPLRDLANRLSSAISNPYTCIGVLSISEGPIPSDQSTRIYFYKFEFQLMATPLR